MKVSKYWYEGLMNIVDEINKDQKAKGTVKLYKINYLLGWIESEREIRKDG